MIVTPSWTKLTSQLRGRQVGVDYEYETLNVPFRFQLSAVRESSGRLQAEIKVESTEKGNEGEILRDHISLISTRSKNGFANALMKRTKLALDWPSIVELVALTTADTFRLGEPVIYLKDVPDRPEERTYLVRWLVPYGHAAVLYGDGMSGKSLLALSMAITVATGYPLPGLTPEKDPMAVLYLDWETTKETHAHYLRSIERAHGLDVPKEMLLYRRMSRGLAVESGRIKEEIDRHGVGFLVVDSMIPACGGEPESAEVVLNFFNAIRGLGGITALIISHITKAEAERKGQPRPFGSVFTTNLARSTWLARRATLGADDILEVGLYHTKTNVGPPFAPRGIRYHFGQGREMNLRLSAFSLEEVPELGEHMLLSKRIRGVLRRGEETVKALSEETGSSESAVRGTLHRMRDASVTGKDRGRGGAKTWGLKAKDKEMSALQEEAPEVEEIPF